MQPWSQRGSGQGGRGEGLLRSATGLLLFSSWQVAGIKGGEEEPQKCLSREFFPGRLGRVQRATGSQRQEGGPLAGAGAGDQWGPGDGAPPAPRMKTLCVRVTPSSQCAWDLPHLWAEKFDVPELALSPVPDKLG